MLRHIRINSPPWGPDPTFQRFDQYLELAGSQVVDVAFDAMQLEDDGQHFTREGQHAFHVALSVLMKNVSQLLILSDSTIDFHNWNTDGSWSGWASHDLARCMPQTHVSIDSVCGSGFVSRAHCNEHFYARASNHLRAGYDGPILIIGGWNDAFERHTSVECAIRGIGKLTERYRHSQRDFTRGVANGHVRMSRPE